MAAERGRRGVYGKILLTVSGEVGEVPVKENKASGVLRATRHTSGTHVCEEMCGTCPHFKKKHTF